MNLGVAVEGKTFKTIWDYISNEELDLIEEKLDKVMKPFGQYHRNFLKNFGKGGWQSSLYGRKISDLRNEGASNHK